MNVPWTSLRLQFRAIGYPDEIYSCTVNTKLCTDDNLCDGDTIRFHILPKGGKAEEDDTDTYYQLQEGTEEYMVFLKNCPTLRECRVSAQTPWYDLRRQIEDSGIQNRFNCRVNEKFCSNANMFPNATIHFSFKLQGGHYDKE
jgi:hypothetical protein